MLAVPHWARPSAIDHGGIKGFSLLELVIVIILVVVLFLVALDRLLPLRGDAEAAHVATVIGGLRSALGLEAAARVVRDGLPALEQLQGSNPMDYLKEWPDTYIGILDPANSPHVPRGAWYFNPAAGAVGYRVRFPQYLAGKPPDPVHLRWRIELQYEDISGNQRFDADTDRLHGLRLVGLDRHRWPAPAAARAGPQ